MLDQEKVTKFNRRHFFKVFSSSALASSAYLMSNQVVANETILSVSNQNKRKGVDSSTIGIGFLGCSHIHAIDYCNQIKKQPNIKVLAVWDNEKNQAKKIANTLNSQVASSVDEVCRNKDIQAVIIAGETSLHFALLTSAVAAHKHIFIEKPLTISSAEAIKAVQLIEPVNIIFHCNYHYRSLPAIQELNRLIKKGFIGKVVHVYVSLTHRGWLEGWFDAYPWMVDTSKAGFGGFGDEGTHAIDLLTWFLGSPSLLASIIFMDKDKNIDIYGNALLSFDSKAMGSFSAGWNSEIVQPYIVACGTEGTAYIDNHSLYYVDSKHKGQLVKRIDVPSLEPKAERGLEAFFNNLEGISKDSLVTVAEAATDVLVLEKLYQVSQRLT